MRVERKEEEKRDAMKIKMNRESARTTQARRESEGGKLVIKKKKKKKKKNKQMMTKLRKKKNKKRKEKGLMDTKSSFGVGPQETLSSTTNLLNVIQSKCLSSDLSSEPGVDPCDRSSANVTEHDEHRFSNAHVISWNINGVQNFNKLRTLQKMAGSC